MILDGNGVPVWVRPRVGEARSRGRRQRRGRSGLVRPDTGTTRSRFTTSTPAQGREGRRRQWTRGRHPRAACPPGWQLPHPLGADHDRRRSHRASDRDSQRDQHLVRDRHGHPGLRHGGVRSQDRYARVDVEGLPALRGRESRRLNPTSAQRGGPPTEDRSSTRFIAQLDRPSDSSGNLLVSSRNMETVFYVERSTGTVLWKMGGTNSSIDGATYVPVHDPFYAATRRPLLQPGLVAYVPWRHRAHLAVRRSGRTSTPAVARAVVLEVAVGSDGETPATARGGGSGSVGLVGVQGCGEQ